MSLVQERERRQTAGNRLKRLLEQQDDQEDEFYGTAYGGFTDVKLRLFLRKISFFIVQEVEDNDYHSEDSEEDLVDSDFDQDDAEQDESEKKETKNGDDDDDDDDESSQPKRKKIVYQAQSLQQEVCRIVL